MGSVLGGVLNSLSNLLQDCTRLNLGAVGSDYQAGFQRLHVRR